MRARPHTDMIVGSFRSPEVLRRLSEKRPTAIVACYENQMVARRGLTVTLPPKPMRLLVALLALRGAPLSSEDAWFLLYGDWRDGGPEAPNRAVDVYMLPARLAAAALGYRIESYSGIGHCALPILSDFLQAAE